TTDQSPAPTSSVGQRFTRVRLLEQSFWQTLRHRRVRSETGPFQPRVLLSEGALSTPLCRGDDSNDLRSRSRTAIKERPSLACCPSSQANLGARNPRHRGTAPSVPASARVRVRLPA